MTDSGTPFETSINHLAARCLVAAGAIGLFLVVASSVEGLPRWMEHHVRAHSSRLSGLSVSALCAGIWLHWNLAHRRATWRPHMPGLRFHVVTVYTRQNCPLCEEATELLAQYRSWLPPAVEVDVDESPELQEKWNDCVPVIEMDGRIRFRGRVSEVLLQRLIQGTPPISPLRSR